MTIRIVFDARITAFPGIGRVTSELLSGLLEVASDEGLEIVPVTRTGRGVLDARLSVATRQGSQRIDARPFLLGEQFALPRVARRHDAAVFHSPHFNIPYAVGRPLLLTVHDLLPLQHEGVARSRTAHYYYRTLLPAAIRRASHIACVSEATADEVRSHFRLSDDRITVIGLAPSRALTAPDPASARERLRARGVPDRFVLFVGSAKLQKNLPMLLRALVAGPPLVVAGCTESEVRQLAPQIDIREGTLFLGRIDDRELADLYVGATVLVLPSLFEGVGLTVWEAMSCGTPVISSSAPSVATTAGGATLLVDPHDEDAWAAAARRIFEDADLRADLVLRGRERVARLSWKKTARDYAGLYRRLARTASRR